jgi:hypothetical protein
MRRLPSKTASKSRASRSSSSLRTLVNLARASLAACATVAAVGCSGGGCSSCSGSTPIPGGFPLDQRITNAGGARVTRSGLDFLQTNIPALAQKLLGGSTTGGVLTFPIGTSSGSISIVITSIDYTICPDGPDATSTPPTCTIEINVGDISGVTIESATPNVLHIGATVPIRLQDLPVSVLGSTPYVSLDDGSGGYVQLPITLDVTLSAVPNDAVHAAREGYTSITIGNLNFDQTTLTNSLSFHGTGIGSDILAGILNAVKSTVASSLLGGLTSKLAAPLQNATCMKATTMPDGSMQCPTGTFNVSGTCQYTSTAGGECVPTLLGTEMRLNLSSLLSSISAGTTGGLDFQLAGGGDMIPAPGTDPTTNGMTLGLFGGAIPQPLATCIKPVANALPTGLTLPIEINPTAVDTTPTWWPTAPVGGVDYGKGPDVNIGVSQAFLNHAVTSAYNSGLLCLDINSSQFPSIPVGAFGTLIHGLAQVSDQFGTGDPPSFGLALRPQKAPVITLGAGDAMFKSPLIGLALPSTAIDFYFWVEDRYVRLFTGTIDIGVGLNLEPGPTGIALKFPPSNPISFTNVVVTNNTLLTDTDMSLAGVVGAIGGLIPASTFSGIAPFNLSSALSSLGLTLNIPPGGINTLANGGVPYLGIFAKLGVPAATPAPKISPTGRIDAITVDPKNYELKTFNSHPTTVRVHADAVEDNGTIPVERRDPRRVAADHRHAPAGRAREDAGDGADGRAGRRPRVARRRAARRGELRRRRVHRRAGPDVGSGERARAHRADDGEVRRRARHRRERQHDDAARPDDAGVDPRPRRSALADERIVRLQRPWQRERSDPRRRCVRRARPLRRRDRASPSPSQQARRRRVRDPLRRLVRHDGVHLRERKLVGRTTRRRASRRRFAARSGTLHRLGSAGARDLREGGVHERRAGDRRDDLGRWLPRRRSDRRGVGRLRRSRRRQARSDVRARRLGRRRRRTEHAADLRSERFSRRKWRSGG